MKAAVPGLRKTVVGKLALAVGAMLEAQSPNTIEISNLLPLATTRQDMREQWLRRLLTSPALHCAQVMEPFARQELSKAAEHGQVILLCLDQTDLGNRMAVLMLTLRIGDRSLPLVWHAEAGAANIGFDGQKQLLEQVLTWLPAKAPVMLLADRFYPSQALFVWLQQHGWQYRLRLKGNLSIDPGFGDVSTTGEMAAGVRERYLPAVRLFAQGDIMTNVGILHEAGHEEPWIIAMDCQPCKAAVLDYSARWAIEPTFSDFKSRGFALENSQLEHPERLEKLILIMALAMWWCVWAGRNDAALNPTPLEKKQRSKPN